MNHFERFRRDAVLIGFFCLMLFGSFMSLTIFLCLGVLELKQEYTVAVVAGVGLLSAYITARYIVKVAIEPMKATWQAVMHVSQQHSIEKAPDLDKVRTGRALVEAIVTQVYDMASRATGGVSSQERPMAAQTIYEIMVRTLPVPLVTVNGSQVVTTANPAALAYLELSEKDVIGKNFYDVMNLLFPSQDTYEAWVEHARAATITESKQWNRVRLLNSERRLLHQFDLVGYFNKGLGADLETTLLFIDKTDQYNDADEEATFVSLAVHELRTPITVMRGYIEVFEDELGPGLNPELTDFMHKLNASAQQLTSFVSNILNVSRIEENQLVLQLEERDWATVLKSACADMELRARVHGKVIEYQIADNLPTVGVDQVSIYEVVNNLLDNAIKYSTSSNRIIVSAKLGSNDMIETTVQDFGKGIPSNVLPHIFDKFYRSHRDSKTVGGTGLGLFICRSITEAHGGQVWVASKPDKGSTFGFSLKTYRSIASEDKNQDNDGQVQRSAHGWIKNHSIYRQ